VPSVFKRKIAYKHYPQYFVIPTDEYLAGIIAMLSMKNLTCLAYVGEPHFEGVKKLLETGMRDHGVEVMLPNSTYELDKEDMDSSMDEEANDELKRKFKEFNKTHLNPNNELDEERVQKQAILEAALGTMVWGEPYIHNQFQYLVRLFPSMLIYIHRKS
jgi:hypothetical protein